MHGGTAVKGHTVNCHRVQRSFMAIATRLEVVWLNISGHTHQVIKRAKRLSAATRLGGLDCIAHGKLQIQLLTLYSAKLLPLKISLKAASDVFPSTHTQVDNVDLICASLDMLVASMGGLVAGKTYIIDHQRLNGIGYCFSASMPPMMSVAAMEALTIMERSPGIFAKLRSNAEKMRELLKE